MVRNVDDQKGGMCTFMSEQFSADKTVLETLRAIQAKYGESCPSRMTVQRWHICWSEGFKGVIDNKSKRRQHVVNNNGKLDKRIRFTHNKFSNSSFFAHSQLIQHAFLLMTVFYIDFCLRINVQRR